MNSPERINAHDINAEAGPLGLLLVLDLQPSNSANQTLLKGNEVVALRILVHVFNDHVERLSRVALLQVDISNQIHVPEMRWRRESVGENVPRFVGDIGISGSDAGEAQESPL